MFAYPKCDENDREVEVFAKLELPHGAVRTKDSLSQSVLTLSDSSSVQRSAIKTCIIDNGSKTPMGEKKDLVMGKDVSEKKVHFCSSVKVYKVSPIKVREDGDVNELEDHVDDDEKDSDGELDSSPPSPVIGGTPNNRVAVGNNIQETPTNSTCITSVKKSLLFTPDVADGILSDDQINYSNFKEDIDSNEKEVSEQQEFLSYSQMSQLLKESLSSQSNGQMPFSAVEDESIMKGGFSTASGSKIQISKKSLEKAAQIFSFDETETESLQPKSDGDSTTDGFIHKFLMSAGFKTASGNAVKVSKESLLKSAKLLEEIDEFGDLKSDRVLKCEITTSKLSEYPSVNAGEITNTVFTSAAGKDFTGSKASLIRAKCPMGAGFKTASGNTVKVSKESLLKSAKLLEEMDEFGDLKSDSVLKCEITTSKLSTHPSVSPGEIANTGFTSAAGKAFTVSKASLMKAKSIVDDDNENVECVLNDTSTIDQPEPVVAKTFQATKQLQFPSLNTSSFISPAKRSSSFKPVLPQTRKTNNSVVENVQKPVYEENLPTKHFKRDQQTTPTQKDYRKALISSSFEVNKRRGNCKYKSPLIAERVTTRSTSRVAAVLNTECEDSTTKEEQNRQISMDLLHKIGRLMLIRLNCTAMLSLEDLLILNNCRLDVNGPSKNKSQHYNTYQHSVFDPKEFKFKLRHFFSNKSVDRGSLILGDNARLVVDSDSAEIGVYQFYQALLTVPGVTRTACSLKWVQNSLRWIILKLAAYELCFPRVFMPYSLLNPHGVMNQLRYRFDKEYHLGKRSALRKIMEQDDIPMKCMILFVSHLDVDSSPFMEVSDGWYSIFCDIDEILLDLIRRGKILIGQKIAICGAQLINCDVPTEPLEKSDSLRLKICFNGCKPAHWNAKLGFYGHQGAFCCKLSSVKPNGGTIPKVMLMVQRVYPLEITEMLPNGNSISKSERQHRRDMNEFCEGRQTENSSSDNFNTNRQDAVRVVVKLLVSDISSSQVTAMVSVWRPSECLLEQLKENVGFAVTNIRPQASYSSLCNTENHLILSTTKYSQFTPIKSHNLNNDSTNDVFVTRNVIHCFEKRENFSSTFGQCDMMGIVARVQEDNNKSTAFVSDQWSNIVVVSFYQSLKILALEKLISHKSVLSFKNLKPSRRFDAHASVYHLDFIPISEVQFCKDESLLSLSSQDVSKVLNKAQKKVHQLIHGNKRGRSMFEGDMNKKRSGGNCDDKVNAEVEDGQHKGFQWRMRQLSRIPSPTNSIRLNDSDVQMMIETPAAKKARCNFKSPVLKADSISCCSN